ncbi:MAG: FtsX-like permease family protein [candidate division Zixibacteria bacterium]|nr:FtsX-like permease family protein [candidate division Zixibacteria bacterium]
MAAFVSMLSFGAGNQQYITKQFEELGLLTTMQVYPKTKSDKTDSVKAAVLDKSAIEKLSLIPGVNLAYSYEAISVTAKLGDSTISAKAQTLPEAVLRTKLFSRILAGKPFSSDTTRQVLVNEELVKSWGFKGPDSLVGRSIVISVRVTSFDSGLAHIVKDKGETVRDRLKRISFDSLWYRDYRSRVITNELSSAAQRFINGFLNCREEISDTLTICGVIEKRESHQLKTGSIIIPQATAARFTNGFSGDPTELLAAINSGTIFSNKADAANKSYPMVTLDLDPRALHKTVRDSVEALGFRAFSFAEQFDEIRKFFVYFDLALGLIGLIALITASLGIVNTMVMSILERKREIGVLKSLGADEREIRFLFLAESGMIGLLGSLFGITFGWLITRVASAIAKMVMVKQDIPATELFAIPIWLILIALAIGVGVSLLAGFYPASRAAHIDPIEALRNE